MKQILGGWLLVLSLTCAAEPIDWRLSGNLQGDGLLYGDLPPDRETTTTLRRARLGGQVQFSDRWRFSVSGDFSHGARPGDFYLDYRGDNWRATLGRFPEPFGLSGQESSRTTPLLERPQASALGPG